MRILGLLILGCIILAALRYAIAVTAILLVVSVIWGSIYRPRQTFGFAFVCITAKLADTYPGATLAFLATATCLGLRRTKATSAKASAHP